MVHSPILIQLRRERVKFCACASVRLGITFDLTYWLAKHVAVEESIMKIKVLCRNPQDYLRQRKSDIHKLPRNLDPSLHPLEAPREYVRALNATKLDRVFAKPFVSSLSGHTDGVYCLCKHPTQLSKLLSGM